MRYFIKYIEIILVVLLLFLFIIVFVVAYNRNSNDNKEIGSELYQRYQYPCEKFFGKELYGEIDYECSDYEYEIGNMLVDKIREIADYTGVEEDDDI